MQSSQDFDMKEYIRKRMLEIGQLEERILFKQVVGDLLCEVYDRNRALYTELEDKILSEGNLAMNRYAVYMSLTDRSHYDATDPFMYPMLQRDTKETVITSQEIAQAQKEHNRLRVKTVFYQASASAVYQLVHQNQVFYGIIKTINREYKAEFCIEQTEEYMDLVKDLYGVFAANHQPWSTLCGAYLTKMLDVFLCTAEPINENEGIVEIQVDFKGYANQLRDDLIPLWNLSPVTQKTSTYTIPCIDKINYEHKIFSNRLKDGCDYLIRDTHVEVTNIRRIHGDLYITCPFGDICEWRFYQVSKKRGAAQYPYPVLSNQYKESFAGAITEMYRRSIKTKGEIARLIESFQYDTYVIFRDIQIMDEIPEECIAGNYSMDGFIRDEIRCGNSREVLVIDFTAVNPGHYLNEDMMSFLVTQVQKIFAEYMCVGRLG